MVLVLSFARVSKRKYIFLKIIYLYFGGDCCALGCYYSLVSTMDREQLSVSTNTCPVVSGPLRGHGCDNTKELNIYMYLIVTVYRIICL